ncbi:MAG: clostripain-related cysteine peptidase [Candidatus Eremiobacteraeota bacterium]|nr:clostripain-related cysteine peptidase [Candidatus Eremiobacteraeota bacterium]
MDSSFNLNAPGSGPHIESLKNAAISQGKATAGKQDAQEDLSAAPSDVVDLNGTADKKKKTLPPPPSPVGEPEDTRAEQPEKEVTFLLYMDGQYPDLESTVASIPLGLEKVGSNKDMNVVVELGRAPQSVVYSDGGYDRIDSDWEGVRRYHITSSTTPRAETVTLGDWKDVAAANPGNPLIHYVMGEVYEGQGLKEEAEKEFKKAEELGYMKFFTEPANPQIKEWSTEFQQALQPLRDKDMESNVYASPVAEDLGTGVDMKLPHNLRDFVAWGIKNYPAKHYVVILGGHGGAWTGALQMSPSDMGMAIQAGINQANRSTGRNDRVDATVFNSCYMGNLESINEMKDSSDIIIASEMSAKSSVLSDWPEILGGVQKDLSEGKDFDAREFAEGFVELYREKGEATRELPLIRKFSKEHYLTLAAVDTDKIDEVTSSWRKLVADWKKSGTSDEEIFKLLDGSKNYPSFAYSPEMLFDYGTLRDLGDIADKLSSAENLPQVVKDDAIKIKKALAEAVIAEQHTGHDMEGSSGLSIWAPTNVSDIALMAAPYGKRVPDFVQGTNWDKKLIESVTSADQQKLAKFMACIKLLAQSQQMLRNPHISDTEKSQVEEKLKKLQQEAVKLRGELSIVKDDVEIAPETPEEKAMLEAGEKEIAKQEARGKDEEYIEGHIMRSQTRDGMSHGKGVLYDELAGKEEDPISLFADNLIADSQIKDGMGHNPRFIK